MMASHWRSPVLRCVFAGTWVPSTCCISANSTLQRDYVPAHVAACNKSSQCFRVEVGLHRTVQRLSAKKKTCSDEVFEACLVDLTVILLGRRWQYFRGCRTVSEPLVLHRSTPYPESRSNTHQSTVGLARTSQRVYVNVLRSNRHRQC